MLTQERLKECVNYDPETGIFTLKMHRHGTTRNVGDVLGSLTKAGYLETCVDQCRMTLHQMAFLYMTGSIPSGHIDHKNRDKADNRWSNLRAVTCAENQQNIIAPRKDNTIGFRGVYRYGNKFRAKINLNGKQIHLGTFINLQDAANAYIAAKPGYHPHYE
jgi:hypothetical protein